MVLNGNALRTVGLLLTALLLTAVSCTLVTFTGRRSGFPHDIHTARRLTCDACHYTYETEESAGLPTYRTCLACHGPTDQRRPLPFEALIQQHDPQESFPYRERFFDLKFSHALHHVKEVKCEECHGDPGKVLVLADPIIPSPDDCAGCHRQRDISADCSNCHEIMRRDVRPPSHAGSAWIQIHGQGPSLGYDHGHRESCQLCHSRSFCNDCHQVEKPQDHTDFWRIRGHGIAVGIERERCTVCHQENFCVRCHRETRPRSHLGSWGGSKSRHCLFCHEPLAESSCAVCHRGTPAHLQATPIPGPTHPGPTADCYRCHLRPPHADNMSPCTNCHK